jgi:hypothetical protein
MAKTQKTTDAQPPVVRSTCGGATLDAVFEATRAQGEALRAEGSAWCAQDGVLLRVRASEHATAEDLVRVGALRVRRDAGATVLVARAYLSGASWGDVDAACGDSRFVFESKVGWRKATTSAEHDALSKLQDECSSEAVERTRRREAERVVEARRECVVARVAQARAVERSAAEQEDVTYKRRFAAYGPLLSRMRRSGDVVYGGDGVECWPDPPRPGETGIVSEATRHLVPSALLLSAERAMLPVA